MLTVGDRFPAFHLTGVVSSDLQDAFQDFSHESDAGKWKLFFFYPKDFTFICPTELIAFNELLDGFKQKDAVIYGGSTDSDFVHLAWRQNHTGLSGLNYPLLADIKKELAQSLGILDHEEGVCLRATFIVDPENVIRYASVNDLSVGRNPKECLRILQALQTGELCACDWQPGDAPIKAA